MNYYSEWDKDAAEVIRAAMEDGLIAPGHVDERSICDVQGSDLHGFTQCHFFAGAGTWSYALRLAGWADDRRVWTASCPCPPFSAAGKKKRCPTCGGRVIPHPRRTGVFACIECGHEWLADARHLWPELLRLVQECRPPELFGEQVSGPDGLAWFAGVRGTLEAEGYTVGAADLCGAWVGSPDLRQRLWWHAVRATDAGRECGRGRADVVMPCRDSQTIGHEEGVHDQRCGGPCLPANAIVQREGAGVLRDEGGSRGGRDRLAEYGGPCGPRHAPSQGRQGPHAELLQSGQEEGRLFGGSGRPCGPADACCQASERDGGTIPGTQAGISGPRQSDGDMPHGLADGSDPSGPADAQRDGGRGDQPQRGPQGRAPGGRDGEAGYLGFWDQWRRVHYADGKDRRVEPESFCMDHGLQLGLEACRTEGLSEEEAAAAVSTWPTAVGFPCRRPLLKLWGNAVKAQVAAAFIAACETVTGRDT